jgi:uncharacterized protein (TIGR03067 family)
MKSILALFALFAIAFFISADDKDAVKKEMAKFQGTWTFESIEVEGEKVPADNLKGSKMIIKDDTFTVTAGDGTHKGTFKIDPTKKLKEIDVTFTEGPEKGTTMLGIYEIEDDTYRPCFKMTGKERPTEFTGKKGSGQGLEVLKKEKKK